jgi:hypothetical protein
MRFCKQILLISSISFSALSLSASVNNYFEMYLDKMLEANTKFSSLSLELDCKADNSCQAFQAASLELLFQYDDEIQFLNIWRLLDEVEASGLSRNTEEYVDWSLLSRKHNFGKTYRENFTAKELEKYASKLCVYQNYLNPEELKSLSCNEESDSRIASQVEDLVSHDIHNQFNRTQLYMFCREDRKYPCYMILKNAEAQWHLNQEGEIWGQPALGYSRKNKPGTKKDGDTPAGILLVNGVMPSADKQYVFGKYRRMILDFVSEATARLLLPQSHLEQVWWKEAQIADAVGRKYLRIHGTGQKNYRSSSPYYPYVGTRGCVAQRENKYSKLDQEFHDQNILLDQLMLAQGLEAKYANHTKIRSVLYVVELNAEKSPVSREEALSYLQ